MKGSIPTGGKFGGDKGFAGKQPVICARNIRKLMKKHPHDPVLQQRLQEELDKYQGKINES